MNTQDTVDLTPEERDVLRFVARTIRERGRPPTQQEIARHIGRSQGTANSRLKRLRDTGYLHATPRVPHGIALTDRGRYAAQGAPNPSEAVEIAGDDILLLPELARVGGKEEVVGRFPWLRSLGAREGCFVARARDDSMRDARIPVGSLVVVDPALSPRNGDIVVLLLDGDIALRRFHRDADGNVALVAENRNALTPPVFPSDREAVRGVVIQIVLSLSGGASGG